MTGAGSDDSAVVGRRAMAVVGSVGLAAAVAVLVAAVIWPSPDRHTRGLLVVLSATVILGMSAAVLQVVFAERAPGRYRRRG